MQRILIVEDSVEVQKIVRTLLEGSYELKIASTLLQAREALARTEFDLVLLDLGLPDGSGFGFLAELNAREEVEAPQVFLLTSSQGDSDKLQGFQLGIQDYITKPFSPLELKARIDARLRRSRMTLVSVLKRGNLHLDIATQRATISGTDLAPLDLSALEFKLLHYFMKNAEHVFSRTQLMEAVWGDHVQVLDRTVDVHVSRLRKKLAQSEYTITTIVGAGYSFRRAATAGKSAA